MYYYKCFAEQHCHALLLMSSHLSLVTSLCDESRVRPRNTGCDVGVHQVRVASPSQCALMFFIYICHTQMKHFLYKTYIVINSKYIYMVSIGN